MYDQLVTNYNCDITAGENYNLGPLFFSTGKSKQLIEPFIGTVTW